MKNPLRLIGIFVATLAFAGASATASFAVAPRTFPVGEQYYALPCSWTTSVSPWNLNSVAADGTSTPTGETDADGATCLADGSYNVIDGFYYAYDWNLCTYVKVDVRSGEQEALGDPTVGGVRNNCAADGTLIDQDGNHYLFNVLELYQIDMTDLTMTMITDQLPVNGLDHISSMAYNPIDDTYYALQRYGSVYETDLTTGSMTLVGTITACADPTDCWGLEFDSNGIMWIERDNEGGNSHVAGLYSTTLDDLNGDWVAQGAYSDSVDGLWYGESSFIAPDVFPWDVVTESDNSDLATTGFDLVTPVIYAIAAMLAGAIVFLRRRRV